MKNEAKSIDISSKKLVSLRDAQDALAAGANRVLICENCVVTPSARDFLAQHNIVLTSNGKAKAATPSAYGESAAAPAANANAVNSGASQNRPAPNPAATFRIASAPMRSSAPRPWSANTT